MLFYEKLASDLLHNASEDFVLMASMFEFKMTDIR